MNSTIQRQLMILNGKNITREDKIDKTNIDDEKSDSHLDNSTRQHLALYEK